MKQKRFLAGLLTVLMLLSLLPASALADEEKPFTRGEACTMLLSAADDYNPGVTQADIMKGDQNGNLNEDQPVTRAQALVMLSRAFGALPTPVGDTARWAYPAQNFTDIPAWAQADLANVFASGIVAGTGETTFSPNDHVTKEQMELFIRRVYMVFGTNLKDDFYATVNKTWLAQSTIPAGQAKAGGMFSMMTDTQAQVAELIQGIVNGSGYAKGSAEQKITDLYHNVMDWDARNAAGIAPIKPYLDAVDGIKTLDDMVAVLKTLHDKLGASLLLSFNLTVDAKDSSKYTVYMGNMSTMLSKEVYAADSGAQKDAYLKYLTTLLTLGGFSAEDAAKNAEAFYQLERIISAASMDIQDYANVDKTYNLMTMKELKALFPHVDLDAVYAISGLKAVDQVVVNDPAQLKAIAALFTEDNIETFKSTLRVALLSNYGGLLNREFTDASYTFQQELQGIAGVMPDEQLAAAQVQNLLSTYLEKTYVKEYFSTEAKTDVENMIKDMISVYKERILTLTWMSDATKQMAIKKLDNMTVKVGYPDKWDDTLDGVTIKSVKAGGSFFQSYIDIMLAYQTHTPTYQDKAVDKSQWICAAFTVNAYYNPTSNDITFPAAVLQAPMYDVNASRTQNLGSIGYIIAHEITHAFDNNGAKYDENGNAANWWTEADYAAFQELCNQAVAYYDGAESIPGVTCNGLQTLSENVADLGSAACITDIVSREANPDYKTLYTAMAQVWGTTSSREISEYYNQIDVHAADRLRGYMPAQTQDQFYEAFGIQAGDGMWIAPEDRVQIW